VANRQSAPFVADHVRPGRDPASTRRAGQRMSSGYNHTDQSSAAALGKSLALTCYCDRNALLINGVTVGDLLLRSRLAHGLLARPSRAYYLNGNRSAMAVTGST
jgi:hypothetical protein